MMPEKDKKETDAIGSDLLREDASFTDIVTQFVDGLSHRLSRMQEAINAADFESLRVAAHQLKGCGGGYGYPILTDQAAELECRARERAFDACLEAFDELKATCERVVAAPDEP